MTGSEYGRIVGKGCLLVCDRVRRGKDSREVACWCVTRSEEGRIVDSGMLVCDRVRIWKDSREVGLLVCDRVRRGKDSREGGLLVCDQVKRGNDSREWVPVGV